MNITHNILHIVNIAILAIHFVDYMKIVILICIIF